MKVKPIIKGIVWSLIASPVVLFIIWLVGTVFELLIPEAHGIRDLLMAIFKPILEFVDNFSFTF